MKILIAAALGFAITLLHGQQTTQPSVPEDVLAAWSGTWDGSGSGGGFDLTLERGKDGAVTGKVSVTGDPAYEATLRTVSFEGRKMTARYDFTPEPAAEVVLKASFEADAATGTWSLVEKASGNEVASGGWKVAKKKTK
jgi:hypothetical protein